ncbi:MAG: hypothetical protein NC417_13845 [Candidatus Gastranaerophilales bacterium]|nr:hypothetical protein [Candidatus Gastranaerophilales bacterium]
MKETKIQWHSAFVSAMGLDFGPDRADLIFEKEYNLNTKPLEIDLLVIKKEASFQIASEIGKLFKGHNIVEYKSPEDHLDIDTFYKTLAYACLYKAYGKTVDAIKAEDITLSIVRKAKPEGLFRYFMEHGCEIVPFSRGVYYIEGKNWFPTQIVVTGELDKASHIWVKGLSDDLSKEDFREMLNIRKQMTGKEDRELADSVLEVSISANREIVDEMIGDENMYEVLMEIMEPKIIHEAVDLLRDIQQTDQEIKKVIMKRYHLTEDEAEEYICSRV